jgi:hypothetical protein
MTMEPRPLGLPAAMTTSDLESALRGHAISRHICGFLPQRHLDHEAECLRVLAYREGGLS